MPCRRPRYKRRRTPPYLNLPSRPTTHRSLCSPPGHHIITTLCSLFVSLARQLPSDCCAVFLKDFSQLAECYVALASQTFRKLFCSVCLWLALRRSLSSPPPNPSEGGSESERRQERVFIPCCPLARPCIGQVVECLCRPGVE